MIQYVAEVSFLVIGAIMFLVLADGMIETCLIILDNMNP
jgi:hypothetical protein